jgi:1,4-alpha-glucan branching enzyme
MTNYKTLTNQRRSLTDDEWLKPFAGKIEQRRQAAITLEQRLTKSQLSLKDFAAAHLYYGLHRQVNGWVFREWAPNAESIYLVGDFSNWEQRSEYQLQRLPKSDDWEISLPLAVLRHGMHYALDIAWTGGCGRRIPAYADYVVQNSETLIFTAVVWQPETTFSFNHNRPAVPEQLLLYEAHVGMAQETEQVGSFNEFTEKILPRIAEAGYNTIQLMAIMSHPYYGSFGYHVANFFSISSRFGTPTEFKALIDAAHAQGLRVIIDLVHSHAVKNSAEGLGCFDGTIYQYFHAGDRGQHQAWDSLCFDYSKPEVLHFLLSNCRYWLEEYNIDGFRFDGITSMLYLHHGINHTFSGYQDYFGNDVDEDALAYLTLANKLIHQIEPTAITVAEDVSGLAGLAAPIAEGGCGFDYRLAMGVTDYWFKLFDRPDESWTMSELWHELTNRRADEQTISYLECHDQAIVGGQSAIFRLIGAAIYDAMHIDVHNLQVERGIALHKLCRLATLATAGHGYLNFIGNEFGHPEWVDFPREGNNWSYKYAKRQWALSDDPQLHYHALKLFDQAIIKLAVKYNLLLAMPQLLNIDENNKILCFERASLIFCYNFHPTHSPADYQFEVLPGEYQLILDSDQPIFSGHGRVTMPQSYFTQPIEAGGNCLNMLQLYLPCRTVLVLKRITRN